MIATNAITPHTARWAISSIGSTAASSFQYAATTPHSAYASTPCSKPLRLELVAIQIPAMLAHNHPLRKSRKRSHDGSMALDELYKRAEPIVYAALRIELYCFVFLLFVVRGAGIASLDSMLAKRRA